MWLWQARALEVRPAIDYKALKCSELRKELSKRGAESKGVKAVLVARLEELDKVSHLNEGVANRTCAAEQGPEQVTAAVHQIVCTAIHLHPFLAVEHVLMS